MSNTFFNAKTPRRKGRKGFIFGALSGSRNIILSHPYFSLRPLRLRVFALDFISTTVKIFNAKAQRRRERKGFMFENCIASFILQKNFYSLRPLRLGVFALDFISTEAAAHGE